MTEGAASRQGRGGNRRPTRAEVAALAGVSNATVSFVLNPDSGQTISAPTRERVLSAVAELGYRPDRAAQGLRTGRSATVGFVTLDDYFGAFAGPTIVGAHEAVMAHDSLLLIESASRDSRVTTESVEDLLARRVDGLIFAVEGTRKVVLPDGARSVPTVLADCFVADGSLPCVLPDEVTGGYESTKLLLELGHTRLAHLTGNPSAWATRARLRGFRRALKQAGLNPADQIVLSGNFHIDSGHDLTRRVLAAGDPPTAFLCGNDRMAVGCLLALQHEGLRVPDDISVMGYDDQHSLAAELRPALTTVRLPYYEMGRWAAEQLFDGALEQLPAQTLLHCPVIRRDSVARPASGGRRSR
jgi:LacI family transcriptional regulator